MKHEGDARAPLEPPRTTPLTCDAQGHSNKMKVSLSDCSEFTITDYSHVNACQKCMHKVLNSERISTALAIGIGKELSWPVSSVEL